MLPHALRWNSNGCGCQNQWSHFGVGAPPMLEPILVGIESDVHWGYGLGTHQMLAKFGEAILLKSYGGSSTRSRLHKNSQLQGESTGIVYSAKMISEHSIVHPNTLFVSLKSQRQCLCLSPVSLLVCKLAWTPNTHSDL